jgi:hypothetical protein
MPGQAHPDVPGALHSIRAHGINRSAILEDDEDRQEYVGRV